jgi:hypothetical protein
VPEANHTPPCSVRVKNVGAIPPELLHGVVISEAQGQLHLLPLGKIYQKEQPHLSHIQVRTHGAEEDCIFLGKPQGKRQLGKQTQVGGQN